MQKKHYWIVGILLVIGIVLLINYSSQKDRVQCKGEGDTFSPNEGFCCTNIKAYGNYQITSKGNCVSIIERGKHLICINCGNKVCGLGENKCNCPEDCKE